MRGFFTCGIAVLVAVAAISLQAGGYGGPIFLSLMPNFDDLNDELQEYNSNCYNGSDGPEFSSPMVFIGGQGKGFIENFSVGGWGCGFAKEAYGDSTSATIGYGMGYGEFGYNYIPNEYVSMGPILLIGGGGIGIEIRKYRREGFGNRKVKNDAESYSAGKGFFNIGFGGEVTFYLPVSPNRTSYGGLNIKAGYIHTLFETDWHDDNGGSTSIPEFKTAGPFISASLVFGG